MPTSSKSISITKKYVLLSIFFVAVVFAKSFAQDSRKQSQLPQLLNYYYNIKNALVAGNANDASVAATAFIKSANSIDYKIISEGNINTLVQDVETISKNTDLKKQRAAFSNFSINFATVAKAVKLTDKPVYYDYCPMKKAYWLSSEKAIKNPYYGNAMLTCGEVKETIE